MRRLTVSARQAPKLQYGSTLVVVTAVLPVNLCETLMRLKSHGRKIKVISLSEEVVELPGVEVISTPFLIRREKNG